MRKYDINYKIEAVKLSEEIGFTKARKELDIPEGTLRTWIHKAREGELTGIGTPPKQAISLSEEVKRLAQENRELKRANEILRKASAFFAASQKK